ncbi:MAG TPA: hypothetical protein VMA34_04440 [Terracidiphilus sp.]|nr:hypothetical protein [Terracidiphilus sp.]
MKVPPLALVLPLCCFPLFAQTPPASLHAFTSPLGFSYSLPSTWETVNTESAIPSAKEQVEQSAGSEDEKKGAACTEVPLTARHGSPADVIVIVAIPFDCFGQTLTPEDLPGFGAGAAQGLKQNFTVADAVTGSYSLGTHSFWIERAKGAPKSLPSASYTLEVACSVLKTAAVCWMTTAADAEGLRVFEDSLISLEGGPATGLVPANAFAKSTP